jgi:hypothetical protein
MPKWALKDPDLDVYYAEEQYGPNGSLTVSSESGSSAYHPWKFPSAEKAKEFLKRLVEKNAAARKTKWKVVEIGA